MLLHGTGDAANLKLPVHPVSMRALPGLCAAAAEQTLAIWPRLTGEVEGGGPFRGVCQHGLYLGGLAMYQSWYGSCMRASP